MYGVPLATPSAATAVSRRQVGMGRRPGLIPLAPSGVVAFSAMERLLFGEH
jgi:hypothetical protein